MIAPGRDGATAYESAIESLLTAVFYPSLTNPEVQYSIHEGRKRIDIAYTNCATDGFFRWLSIHYRCPLIFVECKNYSGQVGNPELDQLSGRFSENRGRIGILVARSFDDKSAFLRRCKDTAQDGRGFIIALDDGDLHGVVDARRNNDGELPLLRQRFNGLIA